MSDKLESQPRPVTSVGTFIAGNIIAPTLQETVDTESTKTKKRTVVQIGDGEFFTYTVAATKNVQIVKLK